MVTNVFIQSLRGGGDKDSPYTGKTQELSIFFFIYIPNLSSEVLFVKSNLEIKSWLD